jgi:hypothetical protein
VVPNRGAATHEDAAGEMIGVQPFITFLGTL